MEKHEMEKMFNHMKYFMKIIVKYQEPERRGSKYKTSSLQSSCMNENVRWNMYEFYDSSEFGPHLREITREMRSEIQRTITQIKDFNNEKKVNGGWWSLEWNERLKCLIAKPK